MQFYELIDSLIKNTEASVAGFKPELVLCATIVVILLCRIISITSRIDTFYIALAGSAIGLYLAGPWHPISGPTEIFTGLLVYDNFTIYFRTLLMFFAVLFVIFTRLSGIPDRDAAPDVYCLFFGATLGLCLMASVNHLLSVFLAVEMASVPSYVLAGLLKGRRQSSEAALKYAVYGAGTAGIMLYGISLLAGVLGSVHLPTMAIRLADLYASGGAAGISSDTQIVLALGGLMVLVGVAFKLSAVPFHFWCPDVFEGASAEVNAFLSVASKAAALALLVRLAVGFGYISSDRTPVADKAAVAVTAARPNLDETGLDGPDPDGPETARPSIHPVSTLLTSEQQAGPPEPARSGAVISLTPDAKAQRDAQIAALKPARTYLTLLLTLLAAITATFGNLTAYGQTNIKRLLAYSTIAQAGYMIMPVPAALALAGSNPAAASSAIASLAFYAAVYLFMNLGAFAIVAFLRNAIHSEEIADYAGLIRRAPVVAVSLAIIFFSLIGLPVFAGFIGKFWIFSALVESGQFALLVIAGLNTAISLFYYIRVVKIMMIDPEPDHIRPYQFSFLPTAFMVAITVPVVVLGIWWNELGDLARTAASQLF